MNPFIYFMIGYTAVGFIVCEIYCLSPNCDAEDKKYLSVVAVLHLIALCILIK